jgi:hypothetical protein
MDVTLWMAEAVAELAPAQLVDGVVTAGLMVIGGVVCGWLISRACELVGV